MAGKELWKAGIAKDQRPDGNVRFSQVITTFGPGALVDLVDDAAIVAGLSFWAKGPEIVEDRLVQMLHRQEGYESVRLFAPPPGGEDLDTDGRKWIKAFRFPQWFACSNEDFASSLALTRARNGLTSSSVTARRKARRRKARSRRSASTIGSFETTSRRPLSSAVGAGACFSSPNRLRWLGGGQVSCSGPSTSTHCTASPGPL